MARWAVGACVLMMAMAAFIATGSIKGILSFGTDYLHGQADALHGLRVVVVVGAVCAGLCVVFARALPERRTTDVWRRRAIALGIGCVLLPPLCIPLLVLWRRAPVRDWYRDRRQS